MDRALAMAMVDIAEKHPIYLEHLQNEAQTMVIQDPVPHIQNVKVGRREQVLTELKRFERAPEVLANG